MVVHIKKGTPRKDGRQSLFLLIYNKFYHSHKPLRESLKIYVYERPKTPQQREDNRQVDKMALEIKTRREAESDAVGGGFNAFQNQGSFLDYFKMLMKEKRNVEGLYSTWKATYKHLMIFLNGKDIKSKDCDDEFLKHFKNYLSKCKSIKSSDAYLSNNSANIYFNQNKGCIKSGGQGQNYCK